VRHAKDLSYVGIECFHATAFHFIETLKVRGMARNLFEDVSGYFKNSVQTKRKLAYLHLNFIALISGVISGFMGALTGAFTFITTYNTLTYYFYS
jgi:hypothetical protein